MTDICLWRQEQYTQKTREIFIFARKNVDRFHELRYNFNNLQKGSFRQTKAMVIIVELWELLLTGIALSMDAFAVSVCKGLAMRRLRPGRAAIVGLYFGGFQALMPLIGYFLGTRFANAITSIDHWIAFALLVFLGIKMIWESLRKKEDEALDDSVGFRSMILLAVATSIDALAVGITFAFLAVSNIWTAVSIIGCTTFVLSFCGVGIGAAFGVRFKKSAEVVGGIILILLGIKILVEHLLGNS